MKLNDVQLENKSWTVNAAADDRDKDASFVALTVNHLTGFPVQEAGIFGQQNAIDCNAPF